MRSILFLKILCRIIEVFRILEVWIIEVLLYLKNELFGLARVYCTVLIYRGFLC